MSKAMVNYVVDAVIGVAFLIATFTGILFLLPSSSIGILDSGEPGLLGVSMATWNTLHEWSALVMIAGVILHLVLHWRWVVTMTKRALGGTARRNRSLTNYALDVVIGAAFVVATVTGILFLLPSSSIGILDSGEPGLLGVSMATWNTLHQWSSLVMIGGAVVHVALHWRWVVSMTKRAFGSRRPARSTSPEVARAAGVRVIRPADGAAGQLVAVRASAETDSRERAARASGGGMGAAHRAGERRETGERRISRKAFLAGTAAACAGAAIVMVLGRSSGGSGEVYATTGAGVETDDGGHGNGNGWGDGSGEVGGVDADGTDDGSGGETQPQESGESSAETPEPQPEPETSSQRVSVDAGRCNGCGDCLSACPYGVFDFGGGVAAATDPDACVLCGRCVRVCPTQAITLRA